MPPPSPHLYYPSYTHVFNPAKVTGYLRRFSQCAAKRDPAHPRLTTCDTLLLHASPHDLGRGQSPQRTGRCKSPCRLEGYIICCEISQQLKRNYMADGTLTDQAEVKPWLLPITWQTEVTTWKAPWTIVFTTLGSKCSKQNLSWAAYNMRVLKSQLSTLLRQTQPWLLSTQPAINHSCQIALCRSKEVSAFLHYATQYRTRVGLIAGHARNEACTYLSMHTPQLPA
jgi:hypothetical protein